MAAKPPLKNIIDTALQPLYAKLKHEVDRMQLITAQLIGLREALCRPTPIDPDDNRPADAAECAQVMRCYAEWCRARGGNVHRSLIRYMLIAMSSDAPRVDANLVKLLKATSHTPPLPPAGDSRAA